MAVRIEIQGLKIVKKRMRSMLSELKDSPVGMTKIGLLGVRDVVNHFNRSQGPTSTWLALKHRNGKPLMDTGRLRASNRFRVQGNNVLLFNNTKYGGVHQHGSSKMFIPQRKWMWISDPARRSMARVYSQTIIGAF